jgi:hypothetical protein
LNSTRWTRCENAKPTRRGKERGKGVTSAPDREIIDEPGQDDYGIITIKVDNLARQASKRDEVIGL